MLTSWRVTRPSECRLSSFRRARSNVRSRAAYASDSVEASLGTKELGFQIIDHGLAGILVRGAAREGLKYLFRGRLVANGVAGFHQARFERGRQRLGLLAFERRAHFENCLVDDCKERIEGGAV